MQRTSALLFRPRDPAHPNFKKAPKPLKTAQNARTFVKNALTFAQNHPEKKPFCPLCPQMRRIHLTHITYINPPKSPQFRP